MWQRTDDGFAFETRDFAGLVSTGSDVVSSLRVGLWRSPVGPVDPFVELGTIRFNDAEDHWYSVLPSSVDTVVQGGRLFLRQLLGTAVGLQMTVQIEAGPGQLELGIAAQTVLGVNRLELELQVFCPACGTLTAVPSPTRSDSPRLPPSTGFRVVRLRCGSHRGLVLFAEPGDDALAAVVSASSQAVGYRRLQYTLFRRPLEKGVVIVGLFALRNDPGTSGDELWEEYLQWRERPGCL
jgi:hypothetical protein